MKAPFSKFIALCAAVCCAWPATARADRSIKVIRDLDGDGHYNVKKYHVSDCSPRHRVVYRTGWWVRHGWWPYYYRPWYRPAFSFTYVHSSRPRYYVRESGYYVGRPVEAAVQAALAKRGYYNGPIDGVIGPLSREAIRAYQVDRGLAVTGRVDGELVRSLKI